MNFEVSLGYRARPISTSITPFPPPPLPNKQSKELFVLKQKNLTLDLFPPPSGLIAGGVTG